MCNLGVCQATTLAGVTAATSISVDATRIYFTSSTKILACPKSGCVLAPTQLDDMGMGGYSTWAVNVTNGNLFFMSAPTQAGTEHDDLFECPLTGCPSPAPIIGVAMPYGVNYLANAGDDVYWSDSQANKPFGASAWRTVAMCDTTVPPVVVLTTIWVRTRWPAAPAPSSTSSIRSACRSVRTRAVRERRPCRRRRC